MELERVWCLGVEQGAGTRVSIAAGAPPFAPTWLLHEHGWLAGWPPCQSGFSLSFGMPICARGRAKVSRCHSWLASFPPWPKTSRGFPGGKGGFQRSTIRRGVAPRAIPSPLVHHNGYLTLIPGGPTPAINWYGGRARTRLALGTLCSRVGLLTADQTRLANAWVE